MPPWWAFDSAATCWPARPPGLQDGQCSKHTHHPATHQGRRPGSGRPSSGSATQRPWGVRGCHRAGAVHARGDDNAEGACALAHGAAAPRVCGLHSRPTFMARMRLTQTAEGGVSPVHYERERGGAGNAPAIHHCTAPTCLRRCLARVAGRPGGARRSGQGAAHMSCLGGRAHMFVTL